MAKKAKDDAAESEAPKGKAARRLGVATVAKPCLVGALILTALHSVLH